MDLARPSNSKNFLSLQQAAQQLAVSVDTLLGWNELDILKPTITPTGEIAYRQEQIESFAAIRQTPTSNLLMEVSSPVNTKNMQKRGSWSFLWTMVSLSTILLVFAGSTQVDKVQSLVANITQHNDQPIQNSEYSLAKSSPQQMQIALKDKTTEENNLTDEGISEVHGAMFGLSKVIFSTKTTNDASSQETNIVIPNQQTNAQIASEFPTNIGYSESSNFSSCPSCLKNQSSNSVFDYNGNIRGKVSNANLFAVLGAAKFTQNDTAGTQSADTNVLLMLLGLGLVSFMILFRKHPAYSANNDVPVIIPSSDLMMDANDDKVLEVSQKTDGTVIVYSQGKEYRICKPELNSESDQFIERLMQLCHGDVKEIEYDITTDDSLKINAPLSKLVTRLGFVGIKRDIFFPRTSKNTVLFRRYISKQDILSMNLQTNQIANLL